MKRPIQILVCAGICAVVTVVAWRAFAPRRAEDRADSAVDSPGTVVAPLPDLVRGAAPITTADLIAEKTQSEPRLFSDNETKVLAAVSRAEIDEGVRHVAKAVWLRFVNSNEQAYLDWRRDYGYASPTTERLQSDVMLLRSLRKQAGVTKGAADPTDWASAIWRHTIQSAPRAQGLSAIRGSHVEAAGLLDSSVKIDLSLGPLAPFPSQVKRAPNPPHILSTIAARKQGQGWPFWLPPNEVLQRLSMPGTPLVEVVVTLTSANSGAGAADRADTLGTLAAFDRVGKKWWIVQFWIYDVREGGALHGGLY